MPNIDVYVCECCGREFDNKTPFPESCPCGNFNEGYFRVKDRYDLEDDKLGIPLLGVTYDPKVLEERTKRLGKLNQETELIPQPVGIVGDIDFSNMKKKELYAFLKSRGIVVDYIKTGKEDMIEQCNNLVNKEDMIEQCNNLVNKEENPVT